MPRRRFRHQPDIRLLDSALHRPHDRPDGFIIDTIADRTMSADRPAGPRGSGSSGSSGSSSGSGDGRRDDSNKTVWRRVWSSASGHGPGRSGHRGRRRADPALGPKARHHADAARNGHATTRNRTGDRPYEDEWQARPQPARVRAGDAFCALHFGAGQNIQMLHGTPQLVFIRFARAQRVVLSVPVNSMAPD
jgi:hypothetical protein